MSHAGNPVGIFGECCGNHFWAQATRELVMFWKRVLLQTCGTAARLWMPRRDFRSSHGAALSCARRPRVTNFFRLPEYFRLPDCQNGLGQTQLSKLRLRPQRGSKKLHLILPQVEQSVSQPSCTNYARDEHAHTMPTTKRPCLPAPIHTCRLVQQDANRFCKAPTSGATTAPDAQRLSSLAILFLRGTHPANVVCPLANLHSGKFARWPAGKFSAPEQFSARTSA